MAYSAKGSPARRMGVDSADYNQDGWMDLFVTNLDREMYSMYKNNRDETFDDDASRNGIGAATKLMSGWGLKFFDLDNDGNLDLFLVNGEPDDQVARAEPRVSYREPLMLFKNTGTGLRTSAANRVQSSSGRWHRAALPLAISTTMEQWMC